MITYNGGGMSVTALGELEEAIMRRGYEQIGRVHTNDGDVYLCEKFTFHEDGYYWDVIYACRDGFQHLYCNRFSSVKQRIAVAVEVARQHAKEHNRIFK